METLSFNPQQLMEQLANGDHLALAETLVKALVYYENEPLETLAPHDIDSAVLVAKVILKVLLDDHFAIPEKFAALFIRLNTVFGNLLRLTEYGNADLFIQAQFDKPHSLLKILFLYSSYCTIRLNLAGLFDVQPYLASLWVTAILMSEWRGTEQTFRFSEELMQDPALARFSISDTRFPLYDSGPFFSYFYSTYASGEHDRKLRDTINQRTKEQFQFTLPPAKAVNKRILVISGNMNTDHAIYRCLAPLLAALKPDYHLTLCDMRLQNAAKIDKHLFDAIILLSDDTKNGSYTEAVLEKISAGDYGIVLFADVGLNRFSVIFSNYRFAPIQITTYGHPVTTGNSEIDYYIGGQAVEEPENPQRHFTEQLVLVPGLGVEPVRLDYRPQFPEGHYDWIEIGLSWGAVKFSYPHLLLLKKILEQSKQRIRFHFMGINATRLALYTIRQDMESFFGKEHVHVSPYADTAVFLQTLESCDLLLDSYHFGSYNRIVDCLTCHKPVIALEGDKSYNRFASALLRQVGLEELVATSPEMFVEKSLRLIEDTVWRQNILQKLEGINLEEKLFNTGNARYFKTAIDTIVAHHDSRQKQKPTQAILIPAL